MFRIGIGRKKERDKAQTEIHERKGKRLKHTIHPYKPLCEAVGNLFYFWFETDAKYTEKRIA